MSGEIQLEELTRLAGLVEGGTGAVAVRLSFETRGPGWQALELRYAVELLVVCQRCLEPMTLRLEESVRFGVLAEASLEGCLPEGVEPMVLDEDRMCPMQLIEDELIVSLPLVAKHELNEVCRQPDEAGSRHEPVNNEQKSRADAETGSRSMNH